MDSERAHMSLGSDAETTENFESPRVLIVYDDLLAGKIALQVLSKVFEQRNKISDLRPMIWKFDLLEDPEWSSAAFGDAMKADILVIATSNDLSAAVQNWVEHCCDGKVGTTTAIVALCGYRSDRMRRVERAARDAKLDFFAPTMALTNHEERWSARKLLPQTNVGSSAYSYQH